MLLEDLRPRSMDDFIGNALAIKLARAYMEGNVTKKAMILCGSFGCGKTTLAHLLAREYGYVPVEQNASLERRKGDVQTAMSKLATPDFEGREPLLIMDEADTLRPEVFIFLINLRRPMIFIVNELSKIPWAAKTSCHIVQVRQPSLDDYQCMLDQLGIDCPEFTMREFQGWRDILNWVEGGDARGCVIYTPLSEAKAIFEGGWTEPYEPKIKTEDLLEYYLYNGGDPNIGSKVDLLLRSKQRRRAREILMLQRLPFVKKLWRYYSKKKDEKDYSKAKIQIAEFIPLE